MSKVLSSSYPVGEMVPTGGVFLLRSSYAEMEGSGLNVTERSGQGQGWGLRATTYELRTLRILLNHSLGLHLPVCRREMLIRM